ncbi:AMP-binding protein, partial [Planctobacterium marinum]|uniref:AMP-binding protein n=1 Tax=Planctobacterium marinum TaxID=1631968 RepID=UPI0036133B87
QPKGVKVAHYNVVNFLSSMASCPGMQADDRLLAVTPVVFDIHVLELFLPLTVGAQLILANESERNDPQALVGLMKDNRVSVMQATPATWKLLQEIHWQAATPMKALCGGEALGLPLAQWLSGQAFIELWNMYGPTETTVWSGVRKINADDQRVCIGGPIDNTRFAVVSAQGQLSPIGVPG